MKPDYNHEVIFRIMHDPMMACVYIDGNRINAQSICKIQKRNDIPYEAELTMDRVELRVMDIEDIAHIMNKETFEKFCKLWREYHGTEKGIGNDEI